MENMNTDVGVFRVITYVIEPSIVKFKCKCDLIQTFSKTHVININIVYLIQPIRINGVRNIRGNETRNVSSINF